MRRKDRVAVLAATAFALTCGMTAAGAVSAQESSGQAGVLNVLVEGGGHQIQAAIAQQYEADTGNRVNLIEVPYAGVFDKFTAEMATGGSSYDIVTMDVVWLPTFVQFLEPIDDLFTEEVKADIFPALLSDAQLGGHFVGMPVWANSEVLFYRKDLFEDAAQQSAFKAAYGYDLKVPTTWQEFTDTAAFFTKDGMYGTPIPGAVETQWLAHVLQAGSPGVVLDADGNVIVDNAAHVAALKFYQDLVCTYKVTPSGTAQMGWLEQQQVFNQGQAAMLLWWAHEYTQIEDPALKANVGVAPMIGGEAGVAGIPGPWYNIIPTTSQNKDLARDYIAYAYEHNALGIESTTGLAARISAYEAFADREGFEHFPALVATLNAPATRGRPLISEWQQLVDQVLTPAVQQAVACGSDPEAILTQARADIEDILQ